MRQPDYLARHGTPRTAAELAQHVCLAYSNLSDPGLWSYRGRTACPAACGCRSAGGQQRRFPAPRRHRRRRADPVPTFYFTSPALGRLVQVLADHSWPELSAYAVYPPTRHLSRRVRAFIDFVAERLAGEPYWDRTEQT